MHHFSEAGLARPQQTVQAAMLFRAYATHIARACLDATPAEVIIAVVTPDLAFGGVWMLPLGELHAQVPALEAGGWSLIFAPQTGLHEVTTRCDQIARLARARGAALDRWAARH